MRPRATLLAVLLLALPAGAAPVSAGALAASRLDPRLGLATLPGATPVAVWVEFTDKGETGPADLAARLAEAERSLTPEARRRRLKAHVSPLVDWLDLPLEPAYVRALAGAGYDVHGQSRWFNRVAVHASGAGLQALATLPFVRTVAPVELARPRVPDPEHAPAPAREPAAPSRLAPRSAASVLYGYTNAQLRQLNMPAVHDSGYIGTGVNVCMLDDGFNWYRKHEALKTIIVGGGRTRDFIRGGSDVQDTVEVPSAFEHGTITLGALGGRKQGVYLGAAYGCNVALARTEEFTTEKPIEMVYWGMGAEWADSLGSDIISSSLVYTLFPDSAGNDITYPMMDGHTSIVTRAAEIAAAKGILVVNAAGNDGQHPSVGRKLSAPSDANGDSVLCIAAVDSLGVRAGFSSKGPTYDDRIKPDLAARGVSAWVVDARFGDPNSYTTEDGTSLSAPLVAGLAACLMQARPTWPPVLIIQALKRTASQAAAPDTLLGWGIPDGLAALRYVPDTLGVPETHGGLALRFAGPNPLRRGGPAAIVRLSLGTAAPPARYHVRVFDAGGRVVRDLASGSLPPGGSISFPWRGDDARGHALVPGLYFLALDGAPARDARDAVRVVVLR